jgi:hypothetical protein
MIMLFLLKEKRASFYIKAEIEEHINGAKLGGDFVSNNDPSSDLIFHIPPLITIHFPLILHASHNATIKEVKIIHH